MRTRRTPRHAAIAIGATGVILAGMVVVAIATPRKSIAQVRANATAKVEQPSANAGDESGVRQLLKSVTQAYNKADAAAIAAEFQADAVLIDSEGVEIKGRDAILKHYQAAFADGPPAEISAL